MDHSTLIWTAFVDDQAGHATLMRNETEGHLAAAELQSDLGSGLVSAWVDGYGIPVVVEANVGEQSSDEFGTAHLLEKLLAQVLGPVSLGSPTLWGRFPGWVWNCVETVWPPLIPEE